MKKIVTIILIITLLLQITGCYTFNEIEKSNTHTYTDSLIANHKIRIYLNSGDEIFSEANFHSTYVDTADNISGIGRIYSKSTDSSEGKLFIGQIFKSEIDSSRVEKNFVSLWIKDQKKIVFEQKNYNQFKADNEVGILLIDSVNYKKIPVDNIQSIEIGEINSGLTTLFVIGMISLVAVTIAGIWAIFEFQRFSLDINW